MRRETIQTLGQQKSKKIILIHLRQRFVMMTLAGARGLRRRGSCRTQQATRPRAACVSSWLRRWPLHCRILTKWFASSGDGNKAKAASRHTATQQQRRITVAKPFRDAQDLHDAVVVKPYVLLPQRPVEIRVEPDAEVMTQGRKGVG